MPVTETVKLVVALLVGLVLFYAGQTVLSWKRAAEQNQQRGQVIDSTAGNLRDGRQTEQQRQRVDVVITEARERFTQQTQEDQAREPETAARDAADVPPSRLRAFQERRLARERLGCAGGGCPPGAPAPVSAERPDVLRRAGQD